LENVLVRVGSTLKEEFLAEDRRVEGQANVDLSKELTEPETLVKVFQCPSQFPRLTLMIGCRHSVDEGLFLGLENIVVPEGVEHKGRLGCLILDVLGDEHLAEAAVARVRVAGDLEALDAIRLLQLEADPLLHQLREMSRLMLLVETTTLRVKLKVLCIIMLAGKLELGMCLHLRLHEICEAGDRLLKVEQLVVLLRGLVLLDNHLCLRRCIDDHFIRFLFFFPPCLLHPPSLLCVFATHETPSEHHVHECLTFATCSSAQSPLIVSHKGSHLLRWILFIFFIAVVVLFFFLLFIFLEYKAENSYNLIL
jgi:hypothetical protein